MGKRKTHEEFVQEVRDKYGDEYEILGEYINTNSKIKVKHSCGYEYEVRPYSLLGGRRCFKCFGKHKKTTEQFKQEIYDKYGDEYEVLGSYKNNCTKIKIKHNCEKCSNYEWEIRPSKLLQGKRCPVCANQKAVLGINTIWDTDRWMVDLGVSEEDAKKYTHSSGKKIVVTCPDCGRNKKIAINHIYQEKTIRCSCGDGKSYPEKFIFNLLEQLKEDFETEYKPEWVKDKRYDFHLKNKSCIIETHGKQHYDGNFTSLGGRNLKQEQQNDRYKKETALNNGVKHYIELDCRKSEMRWIKNSILNSELKELLDLSKIDWTSCAEFANKNIVKEVCNYWNNRREDETTTNLIKRFKLSRTPIISYLKIGTELGWCDYDGKEEMKKRISRLSKKVEAFKDNKSLGIFESCSGLAKKSEKLFGEKLDNSSISMVCRGKKKIYKGYQFKYIENVA